jgi:hypothetical protein
MKNKSINPIIESRKKNQFNKILADLVGRFFNVVILLLVVLVFVIVYSLILKPKYDSVSTVIAERNKIKQDNLTVLENNLSIINRYKDEYKKISPDKLSKINTILPPFKTKEEFFTFFEEMILKRGYLITKLSVSSDMETKAQGAKTKEKVKVETARSNTGPQVGIMNIEMDIIGADYSGMKKLLELIENNLRIMDIDDIAYSYGGETLALKIKTYYLK